MSLDAAQYPHLLEQIFGRATLTPETWLGLRTASRHLRAIAEPQLLKHVAVTTNVGDYELRVPHAPFTVLPFVPEAIYRPGAPDTPATRRWQLVAKHTRIVDICSPDKDGGFLGTVLKSAKVVRYSQVPEELRPTLNVGREWIYYFDITDQRYHEIDVDEDDHWPGEDPMDLEWPPSQPPAEQLDSDSEMLSDSDDGMEGDDGDEELNEDNELKTVCFTPLPPCNTSATFAGRYDGGGAFFALPPNVRRCVVHLSVNETSPQLTHSQLRLFPLGHSLRNLTVVVHPYGVARNDRPEYHGATGLGFLRCFLLSFLSQIARGTNLTIVGLERCHPGALVESDGTYYSYTEPDGLSLRGEAVTARVREELAFLIADDERFYEWLDRDLVTDGEGVPEALEEEYADLVSVGQLELPPDDPRHLRDAYTGEPFAQGRNDWRHLILRHVSFVTLDEWLAALSPKRSGYVATPPGGLFLKEEPSTQGNTEMVSWDRLAALRRLAQEMEEAASSDDEE